MLNAGKYNKLIEIYSIVESEDNEGFVSRKEDNEGFVSRKEDLVLVTFANIKTTKGYTLLKNDSDFEKAYTNFTIRFPIIDITRDMIIKYNSKTYTIEYLNNINESNVELEIQARLINK